MDMFEPAKRPLQIAKAKLTAFFQEFWILRAPLFWSIVISIGLIVPAQVRELYLINAENIAEVAGAGKYFSLSAVGNFYLQIISVAFLVFWLRIVSFQILNPGQASRWRGFLALSSRDVRHPAIVSLVICTLPQLVLFYRTIDNALADGPTPQIRTAFWVLTVIQAFFVVFSFGFLFGSSPLLVKSVPGRIVRSLTKDFARLNALVPFNLFGIGGLITALAVFVLVVGFVPFGGLFLMAGLLVLFNLPYQPFTFWLITIALLASIVVISLDPVAAGPELGPIGLLSLFACCLVLVTSALGLIEDRFHIPASPVVVGAALLFSAMDWNDNHHLRMMAATPLRMEADAERPYLTDLQLAFKTWLDCRPGYAESQQRGIRYPVYLIAAQGGGLYAAYQSATFLSAVQDRSPAFRDHIFAGSGVSGGSVGLGVFTALTTMDEPDSPGKSCETTAVTYPSGPISQTYTARVDSILRQDFLSPVGAALLFPDMLARLAFRPIDSFDRALALEQSFTDSFFAATGTNQLDMPILDYWRPEGSTPALLLNTIDVDTGRRMVITPFHDLGDVISFRQAVDCPKGRSRCDSLSIASGMLLSARFPIVTPAGTMMLKPASATTHPNYSANPKKGFNKARFVDGGYFENSGLDTIADVIEELRRLDLRKKVVFRVVTFDFPGPAEPKRSYSLGEIASPVRALNSARSARIDPAVNRIREMQGELWVDLISVSLDNRNEEFPLGWTLSDFTFNRIACDLYDDIACSRMGESANWLSKGLPNSIAVRNRWLLDLIVREVSNPRLEPGPVLTSPVKGYH